MHINVLNTKLVCWLGHKNYSVILGLYSFSVRVVQRKFLNTPIYPLPPALRTDHDPWIAWAAEYVHF